MSASVSDSATASLPEIKSSLSSSVAAGAAGVTTAIAGLRLIARLGRRGPSPATSCGSHYPFTDSPRLRLRLALPSQTRLAFGCGSPYLHRLASPSAAARPTFTDSPRLRLRLALPSQTRLAFGCGSPYLHRLASPSAAARPTFTDSPRLRLRLALPSQTRLAFGCG